MMWKTGKRGTAILLLCLLIFSLLLTDALAEEDPVCNPLDYAYTVDESGVTITKYNGTDSRIRIPSEFDGTPVTAIGNTAFYRCSTLAYVQFPDSVRVIGIDAFTDCAFTEIILPASLETLSLESFSNCRQLTTVTIPAGITSIGKTAFYGSPLTDIRFQGTIEQWNEIAIDGWNGNLTYAAIHCSDGLAQEGKNVRHSTDALPYALRISLSSALAVVPEPQQAPVTLQATAEVTDQYGNIMVPQTLIWSLYESRSDAGGPYTTLHGITIDESTGQITVSADAEAGSVYVRAYAFSRITSSDGSNTTGGGSAGWAELTVRNERNLPGFYVNGNCAVSRAEGCYDMTVSLWNRTDTAFSIQVLLAEYDRDGKMLGVRTETVELDANGTGTASLTSTGMSADSIAVFVLDDRGSPLTDCWRAKTRGIGAEAWYSVENGGLYIRTNLDSSSWDGFSGSIRYHYSDGSVMHENGGNRGKTVYYHEWSSAYKSAGTETTFLDYLVYDSLSGWQEFWSLFKEYGFDAAAELYSDHIVARFVLDSPLRVAESTETISLSSFELSNNEAKQQETYTVRLQEPISDEGNYSLIYHSISGDRNSGMTALNRSGDTLSFTRNMHYFANAGASGYFTVVHSVYRMLEDGSIVCENAVTEPYPITFEG